MVQWKFKILKSLSQLERRIAESSNTSQESTTCSKLKFQKDLLIFFRQLSVILESGVALAQGILLIAENMTNANSHIASKQLRSDNTGEELSSVCANTRKCLNRLLAIEAGEAGGILEKVLDRMHFCSKNAPRSKVKSLGLWFILFWCFSIPRCKLGLLIFIVPRFKNMFDNMGAELPALASFMPNLSNLVTSMTFAIGAPLQSLLQYTYSDPTMAARKVG